MAQLITSDDKTKEHARTIMAMARDIATRTDSAAKEWVTRDEFGGFELRARELSLLTAQKRVELKIGDLEWTQALAERIILEALLAMAGIGKNGSKDLGL